MKKILCVVLAILLSFTAVFLTACEEDQPSDKGYIVLSFETFCEIKIDPITIDGKTDVYMPEDPMRAGYEFVGWFYDQTGTLPFSTSDALTQDTTLYAKWMKKDPSTEDPLPDIEDNGGIVYRQEGEYYTVVAYNGTDAVVTIPARYNMRSVTKIADNAFKDNSVVKEIYFGLNISEVGTDAFRGCVNLEKITVEDGNYYYKSADGALYNRQLTTLIVVPRKLSVETFVLQKETEYIMDYALEGCVFTVEFATGGSYKGVDTLDFAGFCGKVTLDKNIETLAKGGFTDATCVVTFGAECPVTALSNGEFDGYKGESIVIPGKITAISGGVFNGSNAKVDLSKTGLKAIGEKAFYGYCGTSLVIPMSVESIGKNAFYRCRSSITFASGSLYTTVGELAFNAFDGKIVFPSGVVSVGKYAFYGSHAEVIFGCAESDLTFDADAFTEFKGKVVYSLE